ncbi:hypothetical protein D9M70_551480 [compost metagenome]
MLLTVEHQIPNLEHMRENAGIGTAQHGFHPRKQFRCREGLYDIIVSTHTQATDTFAFFATRSQHDDRQTLGFRPLAQTTAKFYPRYTGKHPVQNKQIRYVFAKRDFGFIAAQHRIDLITFCFQIVTQEYAQGFFVFNHSNLGCL